MPGLYSTILLTTSQCEDSLSGSRVRAIEAQGSGGVEVQAFQGNRFTTSKTPAEFRILN